MYSVDKGIYIFIWSMKIILMIEDGKMYVREDGDVEMWWLKD